MYSFIPSPTRDLELELELQQFYTAHTNIIHNSDYLLHKSDQSLLAIVAAYIQAASIDPQVLGATHIRTEMEYALAVGNLRTAILSQLRPYRYDLLLEEHTKKRTARAVSSSSKAARLSVDHQRSSMRASIADLHSDPENAAKSLIWKAVAHEIDDLANLSIPLGCILHIVDHTTAAGEYSMRRLDGWLVTRSHGLIFKAV
ncbi:hypothetical protein M406DRAFT_74108 [Cryphonectria parasitica EP155]|uniref:Uncharacterized protein n=1 Tax=Cryphonectria parasitica (strain ATCC 38755 / EP155) TaxID=660469 RepID=A0A9P4XZ91_CRYP1|nr:uncharacterized protein M406DRAFT_74108 [Cryphonectria parasitica EP155]KAF3763510.1 hypothetical protein M406DRAFT_74108 [Cryphonectria parasitica EP155]